jgi:replicative DNA helicase
LRKTIQEEAQRRRLATTLQSSTLAVDDRSESLASCLDIAGTGLLEIASERERESRGDRTWSEACGAWLSEWNSSNEHSGLATGVSLLDQSTGGIRPGELWVVGALPGRGKTSFGLQVAGVNAKERIACAVFSLEMAETEVITRLVSQHSTITPRVARGAACSGDDRNVISTTATDIATWPLVVDDSPSLRLSELLARARLAVRRFSVKLVVVDYLRLVDAPGADLRERVGNVANGLRELAKQERVAVLLLSQLRRPEGGINARPSMIELKESGDIEAHAHTVLLLYMPVDTNGVFTGIDEIIIGKQRHGRVGSVPVHFEKRSLRFRDREVSAKESQ